MIKNTKSTCLSIFTFLIILSCNNTNKADITERVYINGDTNLIKEEIARIENGLMHAVLLEAQEIKTFSIYERMEYYYVPGLSIAIIEPNQVS